MLKLDPTTTVRELLTNHPEVFPVLVSRGMCEDCKTDPPPVPLGHFAAKHCDGDVDTLIADLERARGNAPAR